MQNCLEITVGSDDTLTASITTGKSFFKVLEVVVYNLVLQPVDPVLPPSHFQWIWDEIEAQRSDGARPVIVTAGQRVHVGIAVWVPIHTAPPGAFTGTFVLQGMSLAKTLLLQATCSAIDGHA